MKVIADENTLVKKYITPLSALPDTSAQSFKIRFQALVYRYLSSQYSRAFHIRIVASKRHLLTFILTEVTEVSLFCCFTRNMGTYSKPLNANFVKQALLKKRFKLILSLNFHLHHPRNLVFISSSSYWNP